MLPRRVSSTKPTDIFVGLVPPVDENWPFGAALIVEIEIERGSFIVSDVHINVDLPGLRSYLRRTMRGRQIHELMWCDFEQATATYNADYWKWVKAALIFAVAKFKEERFGNYLDSLFSDKEVPGEEVA